MYPEYFHKYSNIVTFFWYEFIICKFSVRVKKVRKRDGTENIKKSVHPGIRSGGTLPHDYLFRGLRSSEITMVITERRAMVPPGALSKV